MVSFVRFSTPATSGHSEYRLGSLVHQFPVCLRQIALFCSTETHYSAVAAVWLARPLLLQILPRKLGSAKQHQAILHELSAQAKTEGHGIIQ